MHMLFKQLDLMCPTVYINGRFLSQNFAGVQRFSKELTQAMLVNGISLRILAPRDAQIDELSEVTEFIGNRTGHYWEQYELPRYLRQIGNPLLLNFGNVAPLAYANKIVTLHDVAYLLYPKSYALLFRYAYRWLIPNIVGRARAIVTVSEFSKSEISKTYRISPHNITVAYNAADSRFSESDSERRPDTFLALAADSDQKNHIRILEAFRLLAHDRTVHLRVMGASQRFDAHPLVDALGSSTVTQLGRVSDAELVDEYRRASAFIFPPLYAGFGIPPIESQSCGCPVIASDVSALNEVLGDSAIYFDPESAEQLRDAMARLLDEPRLAADLRAQGRMNVGRFSWDASADRIKELINVLSVQSRTSSAAGTERGGSS